MELRLGPVQDFIARARSPRDLWSGSYLLSWQIANLLIGALDDGDEKHTSKIRLRRSEHISGKPDPSGRRPSLSASCKNLRESYCEKLADLLGEEKAAWARLPYADRMKDLGWYHANFNTPDDLSLWSAELDGGAHAPPSEASRGNPCFLFMILL